MRRAQQEVRRRGAARREGRGVAVRRSAVRHRHKRQIAHLIVVGSGRRSGQRSIRVVIVGARRGRGLPLAVAHPLAALPDLRVLVAALVLRFLMLVLLVVVIVILLVVVLITILIVVLVVLVVVLLLFHPHPALAQRARWRRHRPILRRAVARFDADERAAPHVVARHPQPHFAPHHRQGSLEEHPTLAGKDRRRARQVGVVVALCQHAARRRGPFLLLVVVLRLPALGRMRAARRLRHRRSALLVALRGVRG